MNSLLLLSKSLAVLWQLVIVNVGFRILFCTLQSTLHSLFLIEPFSSLTSDLTLNPSMNLKLCFNYCTKSLLSFSMIASMAVIKCWVFFIIKSFYRKEDAAILLSVTSPSINCLSDSTTPIISFTLPFI